MAASESEACERTFFLTDVAGSTALHRRHPNEMLAAMDLHDSILHGAIRARHGDPFKNTGDGVYALFERPIDAALAAIDAQRGMRQAQWGPTGRLMFRSGIHTGLARPRGSDYFGPALPTVSRLEGAANPDQILVSGATAELLARGESARPFELADLGEHHFKGVEPIRVYQVRVPDLPENFPPLGGKRETANGNLPANLSSFLGRERELDELQRITRRSRLLTLVGPGGIGKTRLAIEHVRSMESAFPDGTWLIDLSALERGGEVWTAVAAALSIEPLPGMERRVQVLDRLRHTRAILLIDNCEHVLDQVSGAVFELGSACGSIAVVSTSRRTLGVDGEAVYEVPALGSASTEAPEESSAVRLFVERGQLADSRFQPTPGDFAAIQSICAGLEHMPLAIEIAASQVRRLSLAKIKERTTNPLDVDAAKVQRKPGRQQTIRQTLEWSYSLLDSSARRVLQRLAVFSGPFHEEQALAVCAPDIPDESEVLQGIGDLIDSSLLARDRDGIQLLRMLQTVQAFGREKLEETGLLEAVERRHGDVYAARCVELGRQIESDKEDKAVHAIFDEFTNLRSAFERALARDLEQAARLAGPLFMFSYSHRGAETGEWYARIMERPGSDALEQAPILLAGAAGHAFHAKGDPKAAAAFLDRGFRAEAAGRASSRGWLSGVAGQIALWSGDRADKARCLQHYLIAIAQARSASNSACEILSLCMAAVARTHVGDHEGAGAMIEEVTRIGQAAMQPTLVGYMHFARGSLERYRNPDKAIAEFRASMDWANMAGNHLGAQRVKHLIIDVQVARAEPAQALALTIERLVDLPKHGATIYAWSTIRSMLPPLAQLGADDELANVAGALEASPVKLDSAARKAVKTSRDRLGPDSFDAAARRGAALDLPQARAYVVAVLAGRCQPRPSDSGEKP